jgi:hypothetical protein
VQIFILKTLLEGCHVTYIRGEPAVHGEKCSKAQQNPLEAGRKSDESMETLSLSSEIQ